VRIGADRCGQVWLGVDSGHLHGCVYKHYFFYM